MHRLRRKSNANQNISLPPLSPTLSSHGPADSSPSSPYIDSRYSSSPSLRDAQSAVYDSEAPYDPTAARQQFAVPPSRFPASSHGMQQQQPSHTHYQPPEQMQQPPMMHEQQYQQQQQGRPGYGQPEMGTYRSQQRQSSYGVPLPQQLGPRGPDPHRLNGSTASDSRDGSPVPQSPIGGPNGGRPLPPPSRHSPAPSASNASYQTRETSNPSSRPMSQLPPSNSSRSLAGQSGQGQQPQTIAGEPLHDLGRAVALLKSSKFYAEGESRPKIAQAHLALLTSLVSQAS